MKYLIIGAIIALLFIAGIAVALSGIVVADEPQTKESTVASCTGCQNGCSAEKNCGLATCGADSGKGCSCGK